MQGKYMKQGWSQKLPLKHGEWTWKGKQPVCKSSCCDYVWKNHPVLFFLRVGARNMVIWSFNGLRVMKLVFWSNLISVSTSKYFNSGSERKHPFTGQFNKDLFELRYQPTCIWWPTVSWLEPQETPWKRPTAVGFALKKMKELETGITGYKQCIIMNLNNRYTYNAGMYVHM